MTLTNLDLEQIDPVTGTVQAESDSTIDNVEQVRSVGAGEVIYKVEAETGVDGLGTEPYAIATRRELTPLATPRPTIDMHLSSGGPLRPGVDVTVEAEIANPSPDLTAENVQVSLELPAGVELVEGTQTQAFGTVSQASGPRTAAWEVRGTDDGIKQLVTEVTATRYGSAFARSDTAMLQVDGTGPALTFATPPANTTETELMLSWDGQDPSGIRDYDLEVAIDGGAFAPWLAATTRTAAAYEAAHGHRYTFQVRATDMLGNVSAYLSSGEVLVAEAPSSGGEGPGVHQRRPPGMNVSRVRRRGSTLFVTGALPVDAIGRITATWQARVGRRRLTARARRFPRGGQFRLFLDLPSRWRRAGTGLLTVAFAGDTLYLPATQRIRVRSKR